MRELINIRLRINVFLIPANSVSIVNTYQINIESNLIHFPMNKDCNYII